MVKKVLTLLLLFAAFCARANDTLTRAQVYDFNVGDTFDYQNYNYSWVPGNSQLNSSTEYTRCIVKNIYYSINSDTEFIERLWVYPSPISFDTLTLENLSYYEAYLDTITTCGPDHWQIFVNSTSQYHGRIIDSLYENSCGGPNEIVTAFVEGLGVTLKNYGYTTPELVDGYTDQLIYYSKGSETWGTPYYDFPTAIQAVNPTEAQISLFPTVNDGSFTVKIPVGSLLPVNWVVYDITGREVKSISLTDLNNPITLDNCSQGVYVWKAFSKNGLLQTGKIIVH